MGYSTSANLKTEITAQMLFETVGHKKLLELLPINKNPDNPEDNGKTEIPEANTIFIQSS